MGKISTKGIAGTALITIAPGTKYTGNTGTRHNTARSFAALKQFLASGPQTRNACNSMLKNAYGHGCFVAHLLGTGVLVVAPAGSTPGANPVLPGAAQGSKLATQKALVASQAIAKQATNNNAAAAALLQQQLAKLPKNSKQRPALQAALAALQGK